MTKLLPLALAVLALLGCQQAAALQTTEVQQADSTMAAVLARLDRLESELRDERALRQQLSPPTEISVLDFGAAGDNKTDNTLAFQSALDAAHKAGARQRSVQVSFKLDTIKGCGDDEGGDVGGHGKGGGTGTGNISGGDSRRRWSGGRGGGGGWW